jgi:GntR family transcriptional regulator of arabinose operon
MTASNALTLLAKEGWIYRIPGRGSFVSELPPIVRDAGKTSSEYDLGLRSRDMSEHESRPMIGIILPLVEDFFAMRLLKGIYTALEQSDYLVTIIMTRNSKEREKEAIRQLVRKGAVGLIIFPIDAESYNEEIVLLKVRKFPFVLMDRYLPGLETNCVCSDNLKSARLAVDHLWELGHRDIAICSDIPISTVTVDERVRGYMDALKMKGSMINPALILTELSLDPAIPFERHMLYSFIRNRTATAFISLNMKLGVYLARFVKHMGLEVPRDISIVTYDNPSSGLEMSTPFTHIDQSEERIGAQSAELLLELLAQAQGDRQAEPVRKLIEPALVVGDSTGADQSL